MSTAAPRGRDGLRLRTYGVRSRLRRVRWEVASGRELLRWFPPDWLVDPMAMVDLCSAWEHAWVRRHLEQRYKGEGAIVELGPWMGRITTAILKGLDRNPDARVRSTPVHVYDVFVADDIEERFAELPQRELFRDGESFLPTYLDRIGHDGRVVTHVGDVLDARWGPDEPIEFLFNDVAKTWDHWNHVRSTFHRALGVGATVVEQDWGHAGTPWIHVWHHRHRRHFAPSPQVPNSGSLPFTLVSELPPEAFEPESLEDYSDTEVDAAFDWATSLVDRSHRANVRGAHVHLYTLHGDLDRASRVCVAEMARGPIEGELVDLAIPELEARLEARDAGADRSGAT